MTISTRKILSGLMALSLFGYACDNPSSPERIAVDQSVLLKGFILDVFGEDTLFIQGAIININNQEFISDENGEFSIEILPGEYEIGVNSDYHLPFSEMVSVSDSSEIELVLSSILTDVFPLETGSSWEYSYFYKDLDAPVDVIDQGFVLIEVKNKEQIQDTTYYSIRETFNYDKIYYHSQFGHGEKNDTVEYRYDTQFEIKILPDYSIKTTGGTSRITKALGGNGLYFYPPKIDAIDDVIPLKRYIPLNRIVDNEIFAFKPAPWWYHSIYKVVPDSGITSYAYTDKYGLWTKYSLINYSTNN